MPSRNIIKTDLQESYYHIYARGLNRGQIFAGDQDYAVFLNLFKRYLSLNGQFSPNGYPYPHLRGDLELISYCLMPNHFHLLVYQHKPGAMTTFMRALMTSYSLHFNKTYQRSGPLFESRYKASLVDDDAYLQHISRYIHLNPRQWGIYKYSSLPYFFGRLQADWINPDRVKSLFDSDLEYMEFMADYADNERVLDKLKPSLAHL